MRRGRAALGLSLAVAACSGRGGTPAPSAKAPAPATGASRAPSIYPSPARWEVHPASASYVTAALRLADGRCLVAEQSGQRWLTSPRVGPAPPPAAYPSDYYDPDEYYPSDDPNAYVPNACSGPGRAAAERTPEPIVGILRWGRSYGFVGASGTIHEAQSPLGRITRRISPPEQLFKVRGARGRALAVTMTGKLLRWDAEGGFQPVDLGDVYTFDAALSPDGRAVAIAAPEAIFTSDDGAKFTRASAPSVGVQRVAYDEGGQFIVEGATTALAYDPREPATFAKVFAQAPEPRLDVSVDTGRTPSADTVTQGRAVIDGDQYWEVSPSYDSEDGYGVWSLYHGRIDGRLTSQPFNAGTPDGNVVLGVRQRHVAAAVYDWSDSSGRLTLYVSHDAGATFRTKVPLQPSDSGALSIAVSSEGSVLLIGACLRKEEPQQDAADPDSSDSSEPSCPGEVLLVREETGAVAPRVPKLGDPPVTPAFSLDGRSAYFLARRERDSHLALYVSRDGGASFQERSLDMREGGDETTFDVIPGTAVTVSEGGRLGMFLGASGGKNGLVYLTTDADGRGLRVGDVPSAASTVSGFGERVLAMGYSYDAGEETTPIWESLDGGLTWTDVTAPEALLDMYRRRGDVACGAAGCLIGDDITRVGWGAQQDAPVPFEPVKPEPPTPTLRTAITCEPAPGSTWTRLENASDGGLPDEGDVARGRAAWMLPLIDPDTGAVSTASAVLPESGDGEARITTSQILAPAAKGAPWALSLRPQIEGVAIARVPLDKDAVTVGGNAMTGRPMKGLEIAWVNLEEGASGRAVVPNAGAFRAGTVTPSGYTFKQQLNLQMLSVSPGGIFIRAHHGDTTAYFADTSGKLKSFPMPVWRPDLHGNDLSPGDAVNVDGTFILSTQLGTRPGGLPEGLFLARAPDPAHPSSALQEPWAVTLAPATDYSLRRYAHTDWTYSGGHLAVWTKILYPDVGHAVSWLRTVLGDGTLSPPSRMPTPLDLPKTPRPCTAAEHKDLPRLKYPHRVLGRTAYPGTRHPVLVNEEASAAPKGSAPIGHAALLTSGLVIRGTRSSPCVDAYAALGVAGARITTVISGDMRHAWFFREALPKETTPKPAKKPPPRGAPSVSPREEPPPPSPVRPRDFEVRALTCRFDPAATVPTSILNENRVP